MLFVILLLYVIWYSVLYLFYTINNHEGKIEVFDCFTSQLMSETVASQHSMPVTSLYIELTALYFNELLIKM